MTDHSHRHLRFSDDCYVWHTHEHDCAGEDEHFNQLHHHAPAGHDAFPLDVLERFVAVVSREEIWRAEGRW